MRKFIYGAVVALALSVIGFSAYVFAQSSTTPIEVGDFSFTLNGFSISGRSATVTGYLGTEQNIVIPENIEYNGLNYRVTHIQVNAFANSQLTGVVIPDSITSIEAMAFLNNQLTQIKIPDSVTRIGQAAFANNQLTHVELSNSVSFLSNEIFRNNQLTHIKIPDSVTVIGDFTFYNNRLTEIELPDSVLHIRGHAFANNRLMQVDIPNSVTYIGGWSFAHNQLTEVKLPNSLTDLGGGAFANNQLTKIELPSSLTHIGGAFFNNLLTEIYIPNSVTHINNEAFRDNKLGKIEIPDSVIHIGASAFANNQLTEIHIPDSITHIGNWVFRNNQLTQIEIPNSVTHIGGAAFQNNLLTELHIPNSVVQIDGRAFAWNQLEYVELPSSVTHIGSEVFLNNPLVSMYIPESVSVMGSGNLIMNLQRVYTDKGNATNLRNIIIGAGRYGMFFSLTDMLEGLPHYSDDTLLENSLSEGGSLTLTAVSQGRYTLISRLASIDPIVWREYIPTVQWYKNGEPIQGETNLAFNIINATVDDAGIYHAVVDGEKLPNIHVRMAGSSNPNSEIAFNIQSGEVFTIALTANNITSFDGSEMELIFKTNELELLDFAVQSRNRAVTVGMIEGTGLEIISIGNGRVVFRLSQDIGSGRTWSGVITVLEFRALTTGTTAINFN